MVEEEDHFLATNPPCCPPDRSFPSFVMDNFLRRIFQPPKKRVAKYLSRGDMAADLGCGPGYYTVPMAELVGQEGKVYAVDFDPGAVKRLRRKVERRQYEKIIEPHESSASDLGFIENGLVDFAFANGLLCCMKDHAGALAEIRRILKPDGRAYLSVTKLTRKNDPRAVRRDEWEKILGGFRILDSGEGFTTRWALVKKTREDIDTIGEKETLHAGTVAPPCCT